MKKLNILLFLPLLLITSGCSNENTDTKNNIINSLLDGVNIQINGKESSVYSGDYSYLNSTSIFNLNRDYVSITEEDGTKTPIVRENTDYDFVTYLKGDEGQIINEYLNSKNEVMTVDFTPGGKQLLFNEYFANPFEYVDSSDISDDYSLNLTKAGFIVETYTGLQYQVKSAKFNVENNLATSLDITFYDNIQGATLYNITNSLSMTIEFNYDINISSHLTPRSLADDTIQNAFTNQENYTLTFSSDATTETSIMYITNEAVFIHNGINDLGAKDGDVYYKKDANGTYDKYVYRKASGKFSLQDYEISKDTFLPNIENISPNILNKEDENIYTFDSIAALYCLEEFIIPDYSITSGLGIKGTLQLKDGNISSIYAQFNKNSPFSITQNYYNYGTTTMPSWLDF